MQLPIPVIYNGITYTTAELVAPSPGGLADTAKEAGSGKLYGSLAVFCACGITVLSGTGGQILTEKTEIKNACRFLPYKTAEALSIEILKLHHGADDAIEGVYPCPRCGQKIIEGEETLDRLSAIRTVCAPDGETAFVWPFAIPIQVKTVEGNVLDTVEAVEISYPTIQHCIAADARTGPDDPVRLQLAILCEAMTRVNGEDVDAKYRQAVGRALWEQIPTAREVQQISERADKYGVDRTVEKTCSGCGKRWRAVLNTSNFFASALRG